MWALGWLIFRNRWIESDDGGLTENTGVLMG